jgi:hypothetical protein
MTARLYYYDLMPGDGDHVPATSWSHGVVLAEPEEIEAIAAEMDERHYMLLWVRPVEHEPQTLAQFRETIGEAITAFHQIEEAQPCAEDEAYGVDLTPVTVW